MSHQDQDGRVGCQANQLRKALRWLISPRVFSSIRFREDCTWTAPELVAAALIWSWSDEETLKDRFGTARKIVQHVEARQQELARSYQAFLKMLVRWSASLALLMVKGLRERMQTALPSRWEQHGFVIFGVDGSRIELPRTWSHQAAYARRKQKRRKMVRKREGKGRRYARQSASARARKANTPQIWLTLVWHAGTGLPWDWRMGPADSSEREDWMSMLPQLPEQALCAVDAGFVGYAYVKAVVESGRHLLLRVGSNVRLLRKLGHAREREGLVYLWPDRAAQRAQPPIQLRLVITHDGQQPVYLVSSVVDAAQLSDQQLIDIYRQRWGIELFYRHLKQTFQRRKLKSTSAAPARVELEWSLLGLWTTALYAQVQLACDDVPARRMSIARVLRAFRRVLRDYLHPADQRNSLCARLRRAVVDDYQRTNKASRDYPRKKREKPPGPPEIIVATPAQRQQAREHLARDNGIGLTA